MFENMSGIEIITDKIITISTTSSIMNNKSKKELVTNFHTHENETMNFTFITS